MTGDELVWMAGGPQGSGIDSAANIFGRACCYGGLHVYGKREYHSNIKGLHSYFHIRVSKKEVFADLDRVDLLCTFDAESVVRHIFEVTPGGGVIVDKDALPVRIDSIQPLTPPFRMEFQKTLQQRGIKAETVNDLLNERKKDNVRTYTVPYMDVIKEVAGAIHEEKLSKLTRMINVLALGVSFGLLSYDKAPVEKAIRMIFGDKPKVVDMNLIALDKAYGYASRTFSGDFGYKLETVPTTEERIFLQGTQSVALGKLVGGLRFQTYYPITPAADESEYLEENEILEVASGQGNGSILIMQTEDEIAAINMASGAALTGVRAATATSGPGFSLMVEGLGWAGNNEVPVVVTYYQRGAPSTGLPTRHGQGDLQFSIHASHGEFPRIILSSGDIGECFYDGARAFNYAERYQTPVIHLIDKALANSNKSYRMFDPSLVKIERGQLMSEADVRGKEKEYKRFQFTESGVSPRLPLGTPGVFFWATGDEHDEWGHISEEPVNRTLMYEKRMRKLDLADREIPIEERINFFGDSDATATIVSWGSPKGAIIEAMDRLRQEGHKMNFIQVRMPLPLPKQYLTEKLSKAQKKIIVEGNYNAQLARVIREETGITMDYFVLKWNGRPMSADEVYEALKLIMQEKAPKRQVLTHGT